MSDETPAYLPDPVEVAKPWLALRERWQAILDSAYPASFVARQAEERLAWIDGQLRRLF